MKLLIISTLFFLITSISIHSIELKKLPYLGCSLKNNNKGLKIVNVFKNLPAEKYGLKKGDIIVKIGNNRIKHGFNFTNFLDTNYSANDWIDFQVLRNNKILNIKVKTGERDLMSSLYRYYLFLPISDEIEKYYYPEPDYDKIISSIKQYLEKHKLDIYTISLKIKLSEIYNTMRKQNKRKQIFNEIVSDLENYLIPKLEDIKLKEQVYLFIIDNYGRRQNNPEKAIVYLNKIKSLYSDTDKIPVYVYNNLGYYYKKSNNIHKAIKNNEICLDKADSSVFNTVDYARFLGDLLELYKQTNDAQKSKLIERKMQNIKNNPYLNYYIKKYNIKQSRNNKKLQSSCSDCQKNSSQTKTCGCSANKSKTQKSGCCEK